MAEQHLARIRSDFPAIAARMDALPPSFAPGWLKAAASQNVGLSDFGPNIFEEPLDRLCHSANEDANLNQLGRMILAQTIITQLENRALMQRLRTSGAPEFQTRLIPPIIVTGLPRTGTTALHRLLAADPNHAALPYWQLNRPIARGPDDSDDARRAEVEQNIALRSKLTPELDSIHLIRADIPEECMWVTASSMQSRLFWNLAPVYGFMQWYNQADRSDKYREYAEWLRWFQAQNPGKRLVLKAPDHVDGLDALLDVLPEAIVVQTHRDLTEQIGSYLSLGRTTRRLAVKALDTDREVAAVLALTKSSITRNLAARDKHPDRIIDIRYTDLMADPLSTIRHIYESAGLELTRPAILAQSSHQVQNPQGKHGNHNYKLQDFDLSGHSIEQNFQSYSRKFL